MAEDTANKLGTFPVDWERAKVHDQHPSDKDKTRTNDKFGQVITDSERETILREPALTTTIVANVVRGLEDKDDQKYVLGGIVLLASKDSKLIKKVYDYSSVQNANTIVSFTDGSDSDYLSVACGLINTVRQFRTDGKSGLVEQISKSLEDGAQKRSALPSGRDIHQAITTIITNFDLEPI